MLKNTTSPRLRQMVFEKKISQLNEVLQLGRALENADIHAKEMNKEGSAFASEYKGPKGTLR
ncbi:Putative LOC101241692, partial [Caligus rogercresseyi]